MHKQVEPTRLLTPHQAAKLLNLPTGAILKMILRKELRAFKIGRYWRLSKNDLTEWARTRREM